MGLASGTRLGAYEILRPLGSGGMGDVYCARDTRLGREVAIKALPDGFARDPARLARFQREARLLASLMHPNIAAIHGLEEVDGTPYLVLEFVEGETLADRLARGPLAPRETLEIATEIAAALEAAHARGVVHRDLKPANVMLTAGGRVKVLDFGLAKGAEQPAADASMSPTISAAMTAAGFILGTAAYMSPEQARGREVDRRTDIWAFGCILYECLTGRQAFTGETVSDVIARILEREPDFAALPPAAPLALRDLVRRCLKKNAAERPADAGELGRALADIVAASSPVRAASGGGSGAAPAPPSLAILYFENLSSDPESDYFCAGITEDILTDLSKIKGLRVASRNAVARYRGAPADIPRIGQELGVGAVLEGSVRCAGNRVRITAQLVNPADGFHLWAERYDRTLEDVFAVQEEIASSIAQALRVTLTPAESENLLRDRPDDARAYDLYLKGREFYRRYTADSLRYALELFQQATAVDPGYALAWAGIADCYGQLLQWGAAEDVDEAARLGVEAARRAQALDPNLPEAGKAEGLVLRFAGRADEARDALLRTLEAHPQFAPALINLGVDDFSRADLAAMERRMRQVSVLEPDDIFWQLWLGAVYLLTGRDQEAFAAIDRLTRSNDSAMVSISRSHHIFFAIRRGDLTAAERGIREARAAGATAGNVAAMQAMVDARAGRPDRAARALEEADNSRLGMLNCLVAASVALERGEVERAVKFTQRPNMVDLADTYVRLMPELHGLLDHPPFAPRRSPHTLVWAAEAPPIDDVRRALFADVRVESGRPPASGSVPVR